MDEKTLQQKQKPTASAEWSSKSESFGCPPCLVCGRSGLKFRSPYVKEFSLIVECKLARVIELGLHTQFVGEVMDVKAEDSVMAKGGLLEITKVKPLVFAPDTQAYYGIGNFVGRAFSVGKGS
jgi:flavin reductase (DIM6/NTAB) family NADH-FMN oxidoreductase RutF